jgi:hypothetical protein
MSVSIFLSPIMKKMTSHLSSFYSEQSSKETVRQLLVLFINTIFELDILFSKNDNNTGIEKQKFIFNILFFFFVE